MQRPGVAADQGRITLKGGIPSIDFIYSANHFVEVIYVRVRVSTCPQKQHFKMRPATYIYITSPIMPSSSSGNPQSLKLTCDHSFCFVTEVPAHLFTEKDTMIFRVALSYVTRSVRSTLQVLESVESTKSQPKC